MIRIQEVLAKAIDKEGKYSYRFNKPYIVATTASFTRLLLHDIHSQSTVELKVKVPLAIILHALKRS